MVNYSSLYLYDVFISHQGDDKPWVRALVANLQRAGISYFLDEERLTPGTSLVEGLHSGLRNSRLAILVVTPGAYHSNWVRTEYNQMVVRRQIDANFRIIPCLLQGVPPDFAFLGDIIQVDFRDSAPESYRRGFYRLLCGIRDQFPGQHVDLPFEPQLPPPPSSPQPSPTVRGFLTEVLDKLWLSRVILLLYQADRDPSLVIKSLLEAVQPRFPQVWTLTLPTGRDEDAGKFYSFLAQKLGLAGSVDSHITFERGFLDLLQAKQGRVFILVNGFENGSPNCRYGFAALLRAASINHPDLRVVICGGQRLYHLSNGDGELSLLNTADLYRLPDLSPQELLELSANRQPPAAAILEATGGHYRLSIHCLQEWKNSGSTDWSTMLMASQTLWNLWPRFLAQAGLLDLLHRQDLGRIQAHIANPLIQSLFWQGLLKEEGGRLRWRCATILAAGKSLLREMH